MNFFKPEDFEHIYHTDTMARIANKILEARGVRVYSPNNGQWYTLNGPLVTHQALLINIKELPKRECEHKPFSTSTYIGGPFSAGVSIPLDTTFCEYCKIRLKLNIIWEPA